MKTIKAAIIGTGFIGPAHVEAAWRLGGVEFVALAETDRDTADRKAASLRIPRAYGDWKKLLADPDVQAVHNCTPNNLHFKINMAALRAGKHVVSEKPLALTTRETRALVKAAAKAGVENAVGFNYRFYPLVQEMRDMCASGRLEPRLGGRPRAVGDIGSHWFDLFQHVTGESVVDISADLSTVHKTRRRPKRAVKTFTGRSSRPGDFENARISTEDCATIQFRTRSGAQGLLAVSQVSAGRKNRLYLELSGAKSACWWDQERPNELTVGHRAKANEVLIKDPALLSAHAAAFAHYPGGHPEAYPDGLKNLCAEFYARLRDRRLRRKKPNFATFADGHRELSICEAVLASSRKRGWVKVKT